MTALNEIVMLPMFWYGGVADVMKTCGQAERIFTPEQPKE